MPGESETLGEEWLYIHLQLSCWHLQRKAEDKAKETSVKCLFNIWNLRWSELKVVWAHLNIITTSIPS
jgi:hypothetical protein